MSIPYQYFSQQDCVLLRLSCTLCDIGTRVNREYLESISLRKPFKFTCHESGNKIDCRTTIGTDPTTVALCHFDYTYGFSWYTGRIRDVIIPVLLTDTLNQVAALYQNAWSHVFYAMLTLLNEENIDCCPGQHIIQIYYQLRTSAQWSYNI